MTVVLRLLNEKENIVESMLEDLMLRKGGKNIIKNIEKDWMGVKVGG